MNTDIDKQERIKQLISYLKEAKAKQWTIDVGSLASQFSLDVNTVRQYINHIYS